jgi:putative CocE/NonD family hydrolase
MMPGRRAADRLAAMGTTAQGPLLFGTPPAETPLRSEFVAMLNRDPDAARVAELAVPMRDGVRLAADVHLPPAARQPAPVVVFGTPYDKSGPLAVLEMKVFQEAGYVAVVYDCRGRGKSEGEFRAFVNDAQDGHDVVEWVAAQPWSTGAVAVSGLSYGGWITWATASERPPHLQAIISTSPAGRWMQEIPYTYGCFQLYFAWWVAAVERRLIDFSHFPIREAVATLPLDDIERLIDPSGKTWRDMMDHDTLDEFWREIRYDDAYDEIDVPVLHVTGWHDREDLQGAFHHYEHMVAASPARDRQWLIVGPWSHAMCRWPGNEYGGETYDATANVDMHRVHLRFLDRFLRGEDNGVDDEPHVRLFDTGADRWTTPATWGGDTAEQALHPAADGLLLLAPGAAGACAYDYDPEDPPTYDFDVEGRWEPPLDLAPLVARDDVLTFTSAPLEAPLTLCGWSRLDLLATTDGDDTDWFANVADLGPDGRSLRVAGGCLRASYRSSLTTPTPVPPGEPVRYGVELTPVLHTFAIGHRVRLTITSAEFPWFARNLNRFGPLRDQDDPRVAHNIVHVGADATRLVLPVAVPQ